MTAMCLHASRLIRRLSRAGCALVVATTLAGCAAPLPLPFRLIDPAARVHRGTLYPDSQRIEVEVDGVKYSGFYLLASGIGFSQPVFIAPWYPGDRITTYTSNQARAHLGSADGRNLGCEFLIDGARAAGECRTPEGRIFQMVAEGK